MEQYDCTISAIFLSDKEDIRDQEQNQNQKYLILSIPRQFSFLLNLISLREAGTRVFSV